jgi:hypothetical protein
MDDNHFDGVTIDVMSSPGAPVAVTLAAAEAKMTSLWSKLPHR